MVDSPSYKRLANEINLKKSSLLKRTPDCLWIALALICVVTILNWASDLRSVSNIRSATDRVAYGSIPSTIDSKSAGYSYLYSYGSEFSRLNLNSPIKDHSADDGTIWGAARTFEAAERMHRLGDDSQLERPINAIQHRIDALAQREQIHGQAQNPARLESTADRSEETSAIHASDPSLLTGTKVSGDNEELHAVMDAQAVTCLVLGLVLIFVLGASQVFIALRTHRQFNLPLVLATVVAIWMMSKTVGMETSQRNKMDHFQEDVFVQYSRLLTAHVYAADARAMTLAGMAVEVEKSQIEKQPSARSKESKAEKYSDFRPYLDDCTRDLDVLSDTANSFHFNGKLKEEFQNAMIKFNTEVSDLRSLDRLPSGKDQKEVEEVFANLDRVLAKVEFDTEASQDDLSKADKDKTSAPDLIINICSLFILVLAFVGIFPRVADYTIA